jgi:hypothetical protein
MNFGTTYIASHDLLQLFQRTKQSKHLQIPNLNEFLQKSADILAAPTQRNTSFTTEIST